MESAFSRPHSERCCSYTVLSPPAGHSLKCSHTPFHSGRLRHTLPLLIYPGAPEPNLFDSSYASPPLVPYLGPFHGRFGVYECALEPAFIQRRNERERQRVKCVNQGYAKLREHLPGVAAADKRMSKVETLRAAIRYIKHLQRIVEEREAPGESLHTQQEDIPQQLCITSNHCGTSQHSART